MPEEVSVEQFWSQLDAFGEDKVLLMHRIDERWGRPPSQKAEAVELWLSRQERYRSDAAAKLRDAREEETLSIARQARSDARLANKIAIAAAILAMAATIIAAVIGVMYQSPKP